MIAVSQGDPAGIGPEVTIKGFLANPRRIHIGDPTLYADTAEDLGIKLPMRTVSTLEEAKKLPADIFAILPPPEIPIDNRQSSQKAMTTVASIRFACQLAMEKQVQALVTPPINKAVLHNAGFDFPGHTEMLAEYTGVKHPVMMLATPGLRVVPATIHQALAEVSENISSELLERVIRTTMQALRKDFGIARPRMIVAGLNPHAGEAGAFGREELDIIAPLCQRLNQELQGEISGPLPADTLFHEQARKQADVIVCMYHDQALIPLKMLGFGKAVNITLGLPIVRTSVDHGTAYNIAGQGIADPTSFKEAMRLAAMIVKNRTDQDG